MTDTQTQPRPSTADVTGTEVHGGRIIARRLRAHGVTTLFTLSGAHLFPLYDGCREEGIRLVDVRHEQTAGFAAEGWWKVTREPGVCAVTAGPGVTNAMSAIASADQNGSPMLVIGGRAPMYRWGQGSLQEIDHVPFVAPLTRHASTVQSPDDIAGRIDEALRIAASAPGGPTFVDVGLDHMFSNAAAPDVDVVAWPSPSGMPADGVARARELLSGAERPVVMAGTGLYAAHAERELVRLVEALDAPVLVNGLGRGCVPSGHPNLVPRARGGALRNADVALVIGTPIDFRLGFGDSFGPETTIIHLDLAPPVRPFPRDVGVAMVGDVRATLAALAGGSESVSVAASRDADWLSGLQASDAAKRAADEGLLTSGAEPIHPVRVYGALREVLDQDATVIGDGGDFVSYAGRLVDTHLPGGFLDPGPFGCLGSGPGYAIAAALARPGRQACMVMGDGAFGFAGMEFDTFVRHGLPIVAVVGNNGIWGLEKHPMEMLYGYAVAAELQPGCRYDEVVSALGGHGELVTAPDQLVPALERAFASGRPALVNVLTDPADAYPRSTNLA